MVILTGPSGTGKSTVLERLFEQEPNLALSVSHTTRPARAGEENGVHYHFVDDDTFKAMVAAGEFAEWALVHEKRYGTSKREIERIASQGRDIVFDIDVKGAEQLRATYPDAISVFILPPTMTALEKRLRGRGTETDEQVQIRLKNACAEIAQADDYDYLIENRDVAHAVSTLRAIIKAESRRGSRVITMTSRLLQEAAALAKKSST